MTRFFLRSGLTGFGGKDAHRRIVRVLGLIARRSQGSFLGVGLGLVVSHPFAMRLRTDVAGKVDWLVWNWRGGVCGIPGPQKRGTGGIRHGGFLGIIPNH